MTTNESDLESPPLPEPAKTGERIFWIRVLCWLLAVVAGGTIYLWVMPSFIAVGIGFWYVFESTFLLVLLFFPHRREVALVYILPRMIGTATALALAYVVLLPRDQVIALAYVVLLILEGVYRLVLRKLGAQTLARARMTMDAARGQGDVETGQQGEARSTTRRTVLTVLCALLFVLSFALTFYVFGIRQVAFDTRFYGARFEESELYDELLRLAGEVAIDTARDQGADVRRAVDLLSERDVYLAGQLLLPKQWTTVVVERVLDATVSWLQADDDRRVPAISFPVGDVERHVKDATSVLLDRHMAVLPVCTPDMPEDAFCRSADMSVDAYVATYKPKDVAIVDDVFALVPAEVDLSTVVTLAPRESQELLDFLGRARSGVHTLDRVLFWVGVGCLLTLVLLLFLSSVTARVSLLWMGTTLLVAGGGAWGLSWTASAFGVTAILGPYISKSLSDLPDGTTDLVLHVIGEFVRTVHVLIAPWELLLVGVGLSIAFVGLLVPRARKRRMGGDGAARVLAIVLAVGFLLWTRYLILGRGLYDRAFLAHRRGEVEEAISLYRQVERFYPFTVDDFVAPARRGLGECRRYQEAESAYQSAEYESAVHQYEALIAGDPAISLRDSAQTHLLESLYGWAESLRQAGEYERVLDRYRFIRDEYRDHRIHPTIADLYLVWGRSLQADGDHRAAIATLRRILYDVSNPRLWAVADDQIVEAYCVWSASLRDEQATAVCKELADEYPNVAADRCSACSP